VRATIYATVAEPYLEALFFQELRRLRRSVGTKRLRALEGAVAQHERDLAGYRFKALGEPPVAVFVVEDDEKALQFLRAADAVVTGRVGRWGTPEASWPCHGRRRIFCLAERDVHMGSLRAQRLPEPPPPLRRALRGKGADRLSPEQVASLLPLAFLRRGR
jgi:hypothetical protein